MSCIDKPMWYTASRVLLDRPLVLNNMYLIPNQAKKINEADLETSTVSSDLIKPTNFLIHKYTRKCVRALLLSLFLHKQTFQIISVTF